MSSEFGRALKIQIFGASHGRAIGVTADGLPAGEHIDEEELYRFMCRRRPGASPLSTARSEKDRPVFLSGLEDGITSGSPLCAVIENSDQHSADYKELIAKPRPSHADYTARLRYGDSVDMRGGGHFSGRLTAPICVIGGIAKQILERRGIFIGAHLKSVGSAEDASFPLYPDKELFDSVAAKPIPAISDDAASAMESEILTAKAELDSVGGIIECAAVGVPAGLGSPMFDGIESRLVAVLFGVPAVKGVEFGSGFASAKVRGSVNNDPFVYDNGTVKTEKNDAGGILGGITSGMPIVFRAAVKPTPSIGQRQRTVDLSTFENTELTITGRHDPCIALRAVPVIEAVTAAVILDIILEEKQDGAF